MSGVTFSGGDPLCPGNRETIGQLIAEIHERFPEKTIWLYTGDLFESFRDTLGFLPMIDVIVDGPTSRRFETSICAGRVAKTSASSTLKDACQRRNRSVGKKLTDTKGVFMVRVARFEKVSLRRFVADWIAAFPQQTVEQAVAAYERIRLPERATSGSAGYDLFAPVGFELGAGEGIKIPTGLRVLIEEGWVLTIYPRSGLGFKYRFQLDNSVGVIDSDYARSDNEGHIFMRMTNDSREGQNADRSLRLGVCAVHLPAVRHHGR